MDKIIAVDFDGVLSAPNWPGVGEMNTDLIDDLLQRRQEGDRLILWTCRTGDALRAAVNACAEYGLVFDYVNENAPDRIEKFGGDCRKISADEYLDDKSVRIVFEGRRKNYDTRIHYPFTGSA